MKKILAFLTGIVFSVAILITGGCNPEGDNNPGKGPKVITIHLKAVQMDAAKHLKMYDSNDPAHKVIDSLETLVKPGDTVVWKLTFLSGIKKIEKIGPKTRGIIIDKDAEQIPGTKKFRLVIPENAKPGKEKYDIVFVDRKENKTWPIDPYLRIQ